MRLMRSELTIFFVEYRSTCSRARFAGEETLSVDLRAAAVSELRGRPLVLSVRVVSRGGSEPRAGRRGLATRGSSFGARDPRAAEI